MYTQIMKEILLTIEFEQQHIQEFIIYCRNVLTGNEDQLKNVNKLEREYQEQTPIWWYTFECFLYPMLNRALRLMDGDLIIKLGFFIGDLHRHIEQLHKKQFCSPKSNKSFRVYRGQGMNKEQFRKMTTNKGGLLSFNSFLSTSKDRKVSFDFAQHATTNPDLVGILFVMTINPAESTTPFASIINVGYYGDQEDEVLFSMHTVFCIGSIRPLSEKHRLFRVELTLTNDNDKDFRRLMDHIREETFPNSTGWYRLGQILVKMGQSENAQRVYEILLKQKTEEKSKAPIYNQLGYIKDDRGEYQQAIRFYEKSLEIEQRSLSPNYPNRAMSYNNIGVVYKNMNDYPKALLFYEKALAIRQQSLPPTHPDLATSYNNIGVVYDSMGDYPKALSSYEKALAIQQKSLPPNHPDLASPYNNIGALYQRMGDFPKARLFYEKALTIQQQSLPPDHPSFASPYNNIGIVYKNIGEYSKALLYYEKALAIKQQSLPANHSSLASSCNNIGLLYEKIGNYSKAYSFYERAVKIAQQSLPSDHPHLRMYQEELAYIKTKL
jgi:tetratricopeptide (TPR) repeat protein